MKPLQVYLDDTELRRLETWAADRGWTKSQAIRAAVRALTAVPGADPVLELSGIVHDLPADVSAHFDRYVNATYVAEPRGQYGRARRGRGRALRR